MSVDAVGWAFKVKVASTAQKAVLLVLSDFADEEGYCWPSQKLIGQRAGCSERTVRTVLKELETAGLLTRSERMRKNGSFTSDAFLLDLKNQRQISPAANIAVGKKCQKPAAKIAGPEPTIEPTKDITRPKAIKAPKAKARTSLSEDWKLGDRDREYALSEGVPAARLEREVQRFRDHHISKGSLMADWSAAWRTWVGNYLKWNPSTEPVSQDSEQAKWAALYEFFDKTGRWREAAYGPAPYTPGHRGPRKQQPQQAFI